MAYTTACTDARAALTPLLSRGTGVDYGQIRGGCSFPWMIAVGKYSCGLDRFWSANPLGLSPGYIRDL